MTVSADRVLGSFALSMRRTRCDEKGQRGTRKGRKAAVMSVREFSWRSDKSPIDDTPIRGKAAFKLDSLPSLSAPNI